MVMSFNPFKRPTRPPAATLSAGTVLAIGAGETVEAVTTPAAPAAIEPQASTEAPEEQPMSTSAAVTTPAAATTTTPAATAAVPATPAATATPAAPVGEQPATVTELRAAFGNDPFVFKALDAKMTMGQAATERNKELTAEVAALKAGAAKLGTAANAGVDPVGQAPRGAAAGADGDDYMKVVQARAAADKIPMHQATTLVNKERPDLRKAYAFGGRQHPANQPQA